MKSKERIETKIRDAYYDYIDAINEASEELGYMLYDDEYEKEDDNVTQDEAEEIGDLIKEQLKIIFYTLENDVVKELRR